MAGYQRLGAITDLATKEVVKALFDEVIALQRRVVALEAAALQNSAAINANGQRIGNVGLAQQAGDAMSLQATRIYVAGQLEAFKGKTGVNGEVDTSGTFILTIQNGIITSIT